LSDEELRAIDEVLAAAERVPLSKRPATRA
jgi:hypothetical protein